MGSLMLFLFGKVIDLYLTLFRLFLAAKVKLGLVKITDHQRGIYKFKGQILSSTVHDKKQLEMIETFEEFDETDVIVFTYPKTGTHFVADVVHSIYAAVGKLPKIRDSLASGIYLEMAPPKMIVGSNPMSHITRAASPRIISTHVTWDMLPEKVRRNQVKLIHVMRNPKDVICSYFPFHKKTGCLQEETTMEQWVDVFLRGKAVAGDYLDYIREWYPHRHDPNTMYLYYEDMKQDLEACVRKIAAFLDVSLTDDQIMEIAVANSFSNIKKKTGSKLLHRSGKSGGWKNELTVAQSEAVDEWARKGLAGLDDIKFTYQI